MAPPKPALTSILLIERSYLSGRQPLAPWVVLHCDLHHHIKWSPLQGLLPPTPVAHLQSRCYHFPLANYQVQVCQRHPSKHSWPGSQRLKTLLPDRCCDCCCLRHQSKSLRPQPHLFQLAESREEPEAPTLVCLLASRGESKKAKTPLRLVILSLASGSGTRCSQAQCRWEASLASHLLHSTSQE